MVARPRTVKELFKISELQRNDNLDCKAGIELRDSVGANYGAYWYNDSIEEGDRCRKYVQKMCDEHLGEGVEVFLKRGCTEFEHKYGDSIGWTVTPENLSIEETLEDMIVIDDMGGRGQPDYLIEDIQMKWVEFAFQRGDETYKEFTDGIPLYPAYVKYQSAPLEEAA